MCVTGNFNPKRIWCFDSPLAPNRALVGDKDNHPMVSSLFKRLSAIIIGCSLQWQGPLTHGYLDVSSISFPKEDEACEM